MRKIINVSLPSQMASKIKKIVSSGQYATTSEFIRHLIREWEENKLLNELRDSQKEIKNGKGKRLKSLKDLD